jgi:hypothetical protein
MASQALSTPCSIVPAQVWGRLSADRQARVVRLMAQLALSSIRLERR